MKNRKSWLTAGLVFLLVITLIGAYQSQKSSSKTTPTEYETPENAVPVFSSQIIKVGAFGQDVYELQGRLAFLGFYKGKLDSNFGESTKKSVMWFQSEFGMKADGVAGAKTKLKLYTASKDWKPQASSYNPNPNAGKENTSGSSESTSGDKENTSSNSNSNSGELSSSNPLGLSSNDMKIMANAVNGEARGESFEGQVAVAAVILNRVKSPSFPNTVSGVIFQPGAFTAVADGQIWLEPNESSRKAVREAMNGMDPSGGCLYYFNPETATSKWIWSRPQVKTIGKHIFCM
ncbi:N-acetylmuramoyl-L-alanine amidase [Paenibacillus shirakamiensis]|uniref:Spore cortex-lytic enzyme n=1 Tax=Paenibacillus shirakamiensis TaxID=1265935 RepID=A0ABS4JIV8_9BACL|nr:spore cortex-lytic enzyme [Paenibacillus shirakamiensis]MBP2001055.1 N-acetylmuramoyl-L-alanine amidase [Paenibacillus shirakamiensis]